MLLLCKCINDINKFHYFTGTSTLQNKIFAMWGEYQAGNLSVNGLLNQVKDIYTSKAESPLGD